MNSLIFIVDDEPGHRDLLSAFAESAGLRFEEFRDGKEALERIRVPDSERPALIFSDIEMPFINGVELKRAIAKLAPEVPVVLMSGMPRSALARELPDEVDDVLQKPFELSVFKATVLKHTRTPLDYLLDKVMKHDHSLAGEFARGGGLRGLLDLCSDESKHTTMPQKIALLRRVQKCGASMTLLAEAVVVVLMKQTYPRAHAEQTVREGLAEILGHCLAEKKD